MKIVPRKPFPRMFFSSFRMRRMTYLNDYDSYSDPIKRNVVNFFSFIESIAGMNRSILVDYLLAGTNGYILLIILMNLLQNKSPQSILVWQPKYDDIWNYNALLSENVRKYLIEKYGLRYFDGDFQKLIEREILTFTRNSGTRIYKLDGSSKLEVAKRFPAGVIRFFVKKNTNNFDLNTDSFNPNKNNPVLSDNIFSGKYYYMSTTGESVFLFAKNVIFVSKIKGFDDDCLRDVGIRTIGRSDKVSSLFDFIFRPIEDIVDAATINFE